MERKFIAFVFIVVVSCLCPAGLLQSEDFASGERQDPTSLSAPVGKEQKILSVIDIADLNRSELEALESSREIELWFEIGERLAVVGSSELSSMLENSSYRFRIIDSDFDPARYLIIRSRDPERAKKMEGFANIIIEAGGFYLVRIIEGRESDLSSLETFHFSVSTLPQESLTIYGRYRGPSEERRGMAWDPEVQAVIDDLDANYLNAKTDELSHVVSRNCLSSKFRRATDYLTNEWANLGLSSELDPFQVSTNTVNNVISEIQGLLYPDDVYIACGHYDAYGNNPGADDNASGTAGTLALAKALMLHPPLSTIRFVDFAAEEQGMVGSTHYVSDLLAAHDHDRIKGVINMDMIAYENRTDGKIDVLLEGRARLSQPLMDNLTESALDYTTLEVPFVSYNPYGSDHMPFLNKNMPTLLTIENEDGANPYYHGPGDTYETLNHTLHREITKMNLATLVKLSMVRDPDDAFPPEAPNGLSVSDVTHSAVTLVWSASGDDGITGKAAAYDLRYSTSQILNETDFANATRAVGEPRPSPSGDYEEFTIMGLPPGTKFYFSMKSIDDNLNNSTLTLSSPHATTDPVEVSFYDDVESGTGGWGNDPAWHVETYRNRTPGGSYSWKCGGSSSSYYSSNLNASLVSPYVTLGPGAVLQFWHRMLAKETNDTQSGDGGIVEIQNLGSSDWSQISPKEGYGYTSSGGPFPAGTPLFAGNIFWKEENFDLSSYSGDVRFRFRFGSDGANGWEGWYIDDVAVVNQLIPVEVPDGTGEEPALRLSRSDADLLFAWGPVPGADFYNLYRGTIASIGGGLYDHSCLQGRVSGLSLELPDTDGDYYYLVSAQNNAGEGPLGRDSTGNVIPIDDANRCVP